MPLSVAGFLYGPSSQFYDHIAPLCVYLDIPLIVTEKKVSEHLQKIYPSLIIYEYSYLDVAQHVVARFDVILSCHPRNHIEGMFGFTEIMLQKQLVYFFVPHGNSDKGHRSELIECIREESLVCVYGEKMLDFFSEKGARHHLFGYVHLGNYREQVYAKLRPHFQTLLSHLAPLDARKKTVLFAPTWDDAEDSNSLFGAIDALLTEKPDDISLIVKPHPNTFQTHPAKMTRLEAEIEQIEDVFFIKEFPVIYALLDRADIYIGDMSSVGYDFLTYNRPMFFLNPNRRDPKEDRGLLLTRCGEVIFPESYDALYEIIEHPQTELKKLRHDMHYYTFGSPVSQEGIKKRILTLSEQFLQTQDPKQ